MYNIIIIAYTKYYIHSLCFNNLPSPQFFKSPTMNVNYYFCHKRK